MAINLITRYAEGKLLGISAGTDANQLVVSVSQDGAHLHDATTKKLVRRFPLGSNKADLIAPVVGDPDTNSYFAALRDSARSMDYLLSWESGVDKVPLLSDISPRIPIDGKLASLHLLHNAEGSSAVIVLADGSVAIPCWNDFKLQFVSTKPAKTACTYAVSSRDRLAVITQQEGHDAFLEIFRFNQQGISKSAGFSLTAPPGAIIASVTFCSSILACLWSTGKLSMYSQQSAQGPYTVGLDYQLDPCLLDTPSTNDTGSRKRKALGDPAADPHPLSRVGVLALDETRLLLVAADTSQDQVDVAVLDSRYGCVLSRTKLALTQQDYAQAQPGRVHLDSVAGNIVLSVAGCTYALHIDLPSAELANLVGKLGLPAAEHAAGLLSASDQCQRSLPESSILERMDSVCYVSAETPPAASTSYRPRLLLQAISSSTDGSRSKDKKDTSRLHSQHGASSLGTQHADLSRQANALLRALLESQHQQAPAKAQEPNATNRTGAGTPSAQSADGVDNVVSTLQLLDDVCSFLSQCHKQKVLVTTQLPQLACLHLAQAGRWQQLSNVLQLHPLHSLHDCPGLLQLLVSSSQHRILAMVCQTVQDVSVDCIASALSAVLASSAGSEAQKQYQERVRSAAEASVRAAEARPADASKMLNARLAAAAVDGFSAAEVCLHSLVSVPLDPMALVVAARQLRGRQVHMLLRYLAKWVQKYSQQLGPGPHPKAISPVLRIPAFAHVLDWVKALLDAHLAMLILHKGLGRVLGSLRGTVGLQLEATEKLARIRGTAEHMKAAAALPAASMAAAASYTVELLDLRVVKQQAA